MATPIGLVIDCAASSAATLVRFWTEALHYQVQQPPDGAATWADYWRDHGMSEEELAEFDDDGGGYDAIVDSEGVGPRIWFQPVPEAKAVKNRLHLDLIVSGGRSHPLEQRIPLVDKEVERLQSLGATVFEVLRTEGLDHYAVVMQDPEGNEFCVV
jgi:hypothetical protein